MYNQVEQNIAKLSLIAHDGFVDIVFFSPIYIYLVNYSNNNSNNNYDWIKYE